MKTRKNISKRNRKITKRGGGDIINLRSATMKHETKGPNTFQVSTDGKNFTDYFTVLTDEQSLIDYIN